MDCLTSPQSPKSVWNRIPDDHRDDLIEFALEHEALTSRGAGRQIHRREAVLCL